MNAQKVRDAIDLIADAMNLNEALSMAATSLPAEQAGPLGAVSDAASLKMDEAKALLYAALDDGPQPVINTYRGQPLLVQREGGAVAIETADGYWVMAFSHAEGDKPNVTFVDRDILVGTI